MAQSQKEAHSGQNPPRGAENASENLHTLASVLQDIMPVLDRIQNRSPHSGAPGYFGFGQMSVETLAAIALVSDMGADSLRRLTAYLDANAERFPGLEDCAPLVATAARALAARDYAQAFTLLFDVYRTIAVMRLDNPKMPAPGSVTHPLSEEDRQSGAGGPKGSPPN